MGCEAEVEILSLGDENGDDEDDHVDVNIAPTKIEKSIGTACKIKDLVISDEKDYCNGVGNSGSDGSSGCRNGNSF